MADFNGMPYRTIGTSGLKASSIGLGTWKFGYPEKGDQSRVGRDAAFQIFDRAVELGVTFWDTANRYNFGTGNCERVIGEWFAANPSMRRNIVLASKICGQMDGTTPNHQGLSRSNIIESVYSSLDRLGLDYIDLLYFHSPDGSVPVTESLEAIEDLVRQDLIRYFGVSNYNRTQLSDMLAASGTLSTRCRPVAVQNKFDIIGKETSDKPCVSNYCAEKGLSFIAYSPLAGGLLTGRYSDPSKSGKGDRLFDEGALANIPASSFEKAEKLKAIAEAQGVTLAGLTLSYMLTLKGFGPVIPAASTLKQLEDNAAAGHYVPDAQTCEQIKEIVG